MDFHFWAVQISSESFTIFIWAVPASGFRWLDACHLSGIAESVPATPQDCPGQNVRGPMCGALLNHSSLLRKGVREHSTCTGVVASPVDLLNVLQVLDGLKPGSGSC